MTEKNKTENQKTPETVKEKPLIIRVFDEITIHNFKMLSLLKEGEKLYLDEKNKFYKDERYFQTIRRKLDGSNRYDLLLPFFNSYLKSLVQYDKLTQDEIKLLNESIKGLQVLKKTYGDFVELGEIYKNIKQTLEDIEKDLNKKKTKEFGVNCEIIKSRRTRECRWGEHY